MNKLFKLKKIFTVDVLFTPRKNKISLYRLSNTSSTQSYYIKSIRIHGNRNYLYFFFNPKMSLLLIT